MQYKCSDRMKAVLYTTLVFTIGVTCEPHCSKYAYEEKLLERMIQVQFDVKQFARRLDNIEEDVRQFISQSNKKMQDYDKALDGQQIDVSKEITNALSSLDNWKKNMTLVQEKLLLDNDMAIGNMTLFKGKFHILILEQIIILLLSI